MPNETFSIALYTKFKASLPAPEIQKFTRRFAVLKRYRLPDTLSGMDRFHHDIWRFIAVSVLNAETLACERINRCEEFAFSLIVTN